MFSSIIDSSSESDLERQRAAERALRKYKKSHKRRAFEDEMEKQRKKLLKVEEKLRKHKERKVGVQIERTTGFHLSLSFFRCKNRQFAPGSTLLLKKSWYWKLKLCAWKYSC